jgi:transposase
VVRKSPLPLKFAFALWPRQLLVKLIADRFGVRVSTTTVGRWLAAMGLRMSRPRYVAYEQDPARVRQWLQRQ